jgi:phage portal protein BeeE
MILDRFLERRAAEEVAGGTLTDKSWIASLITGSGGGMTTTGQHVTPWSAEGIPAIYACQRAISETVGQLPLKLMRRVGRNMEPDENNPLYTCLHDLANPEMTAFEFKEMLTRHLGGWGDAYGEIVRDGAGRITALWPLLPWRMTVDREPDTGPTRRRTADRSRGGSTRGVRRSST